MNVPPDALESDADKEAAGAEAPLKREPFLEQTDWLSFGCTALVAFAVYWFTMAPSLTLENSGILATAAFYGGLGYPPGYPLWCVYAHLFARFLPFSNIAWRVGLSSVVAASLACGLVALITSRGGGRIVEGIYGAGQRSVKEVQWLRIMAGLVAGMAFGFDTVFWETAVIADVWPLTLLLFAVTLCVLMRWQHAPEQRRYLYAACFCHGLALCNSEALAVALPGLELFVFCTDSALGRDLFLTTTLLLTGILSVAGAGVLSLGAMWPVFAGLWTFTLLLSAALVVKTHAAFTNWKAIIACGGWLMLGLTPYLYLPIFSMTNPPMNWGYPRTVPGFIHVITRGQYERMNPTTNLAQYLPELRLYALSAVKHFGLVYLLLAVIPFCYMRRMRPEERRLMFGMVGLFFFLAFFWLAMLSPSGDNGSINLYKEFFSPSHLLLAIWAGYGIALLGVKMTGAGQAGQV